MQGAFGQNHNYDQIIIKKFFLSLINRSRKIYIKSEFTKEGLGQKSQKDSIFLIKGWERQRMKKILVVDDASFMRLMIKQVLSRYGYADVVEAENGEVAVKKFADERPDLTLLDITMPVMDGLSALDGILSMDSEAKVIMCSAVAQESMVKEALDRGALDFIVKPFRPEELIKTVRQYV